MIEFQHLKKLFLSKGLDPFGPFRSRSEPQGNSHWLVSLLDQAASQRDRAKGNEYTSASVGQPRYAQEALTCCQGNFWNSALAKSCKAAVPLPVTQLRAGVSLLGLYLLQEFAEHMSGLGAAVPGSRRGTWWWRRRAAASGSTASAAGAASASPARRGGSWRAARRGSPPRARTRSLPAARAKSAVTACQTLPPRAFKLFLAK